MGEPKRRFPEAISYWQLLWDSARITQEVYDYPYDGSGSEEDPYIIEWIPEDRGLPYNMHKTTKWVCGGLCALCTLAVALNSSTYAGAFIEYTLYFRAKQIVITLGLSLFVLGFALGPLLWSPLSELYGRRIVYFLSYGGLTAFNGGAIGSKNIATLLILRFWAGVFGSAPLTIGGGTVADCFTANERGLALGAFALAPFLGPTIGPLCGGYIGENFGWKWVQGFLTIFSGVLWILVSVFIPETYHLTLLRARAKKMSHLTGKVYKSRPDLGSQHLSGGRIIYIAICRPIIMLFKEPIVLFLSLYMAIIYGTLYLLFGAYPIVYQLHRGWSEGKGGLAFLGVAIGMIGSWLTLFPVGKVYAKKVAASTTGHIPPEERLPIAMYGAVAVPLGIFWFAWTNAPSVHWLASVAAGVPFGFGMVLVFVATLNYLVDVYTIYSASALAANSVLRSLFGFAFPLFTPDMYDRLGIHWATCVPGFLAAACLPLPFLFYRYGSGIRARCKYAAESEHLNTQQLALTSRGKREMKDPEDMSTPPSELC